jgi:hypothetical protein
MRQLIQLSQQHKETNYTGLWDLQVSFATEGGEQSEPNFFLWFLFMFK